MIAADPRPVETACDNGPAPTDAEALARRIIADSGFETTEPVPARIVGIDGLQMDVAMSDTGTYCFLRGYPTVLNRRAREAGGYDSSWSTTPASRPRS